MLPDAYVWPNDAEFPSVVCEAGWGEELEDLKKDAQLWLLHTGGQTRVVIVVSFTEKMIKHSRKAPEQETEDEEEVQPGESASEEETVIDGIDEATDKNNLADRLLDLNRRGNLREPLVSDLGATLHVYRASEDGQDIVQTYGATLLPQLEVEGGGPEEFGVTMQDILGDSIPEDKDPGHHIIFSLEELEDFITSSILDTERIRAARRAKKLMQMAGV